MEVEVVEVTEQRLKKPFQLSHGKIDIYRLFNRIDYDKNIQELYYLLLEYTNINLETSWNNSSITTNM